MIKVLITLIFITYCISTVYSQCYCHWHEAPALGPIPAPSTPGSDNFGAGNSLSINKNILAIGSQNENNGLGVVRIYTRFSNFDYWTPRLNVTAGRPAGTTGVYWFGSIVRVAVDNNVVVIEGGSAVGANPMLYSFERSGPSSWIQVVPAFAVTNHVLAVALFTNVMVISTQGGRPSFTNYIYTKINYQWTLQTTFTNPDGATVSYSTLAMAGNTTFVGGSSLRNVHIYDVGLVNGVVNITGFSSFNVTAAPTAVAIHPNGNLAYAISNGVLYMFSRSAAGSPWTATGTLNSWGSIAFVNALRVSAAGNYLVVSDTQSPNGVSNLCARNNRTTGAVFVWTLSGGVPTPDAMLKPIEQDDAFGSNLAFSANQGNLIVAKGAFDNVYSYFEQGSIQARPSCSPGASVRPTSNAASPLASTSASPSPGIFKKKKGIFDNLRKAAAGKH